MPGIRDPPLGCRVSPRAPSLRCTSTAPVCIQTSIVERTGAQHPVSFQSERREGEQGTTMNWSGKSCTQPDGPALKGTHSLQCRPKQLILVVEEGPIHCICHCNEILSHFVLPPVILNWFRWTKTQASETVQTHPDLASAARLAVDLACVAGFTGRLRSRSNSFQPAANLRGLGGPGVTFA